MPTPTANTKFDDILLDNATVFFTNADVTAIDALMTAIQTDKLGTTKGEFKVKVEPQIRGIEYAGKMDRDTKEAERITGWKITAEGEMLNFNDKILTASLMVKETNASTKYDVYGLKKSIDVTDYKSLVAIGKMKNRNDYGVIILNNTFNDAGLEFGMKDNDEASTKFNFTAKYTADDDTPPFKFLKPKA